MLISNHEIIIYKHLRFARDRAGITSLRVAFSNSIEGSFGAGVGAAAAALAMAVAALAVAVAFHCW